MWCHCWSRNGTINRRLCRRIESKIKHCNCVITWISWIRFATSCQTESLRFYRISRCSCDSYKRNKVRFSRIDLSSLSHRSIRRRHFKYVSSRLLACLTHYYLYHFVHFQKAFEDYKKSCDVGKGALFFCEGNGWTRRNIQFKDHYARAVLILGYPARKEFYKNISEKEIYDLPAEDFYTYDTITRVASCLKSVYTDTKDYCTIILADQKLRAESDFLPLWMTHNLKG